MSLFACLKQSMILLRQLNRFLVDAAQPCVPLYKTRSLIHCSLLMYYTNYYKTGLKSQDATYFKYWLRKHC